MDLKKMNNTIYHYLARDEPTDPLFATFILIILLQ